MPSPSTKPEPATAAAGEKPPAGLAGQWSDHLRKADLKFRRVDELIWAREQREAAQVVSPVFPAWSTQLRPAMAAMTAAVTAARLSRPPRLHSPDGVAGGDEKRMASLEALVFEMEVEGEDIEHEFRQLAATVFRWGKEAMSAVEAGNDHLARQLLALRSEGHKDLARLSREVTLSRRICGEYRAFLDELHRSR